LPLPIQALAIRREALEITIAKRGPGIHVFYERRDQRVFPTVHHDLKFRAMLWEGLSVVFGTGAPASNEEISARLRNITASWFGEQSGPSWQGNLSARPQTSELGDEIYATDVVANDESWNGICRIPGLPSCAAALPISTGATKEEEAKVMTQYAWTVGWSVKGTIALIMDEGTEGAFEFSITYELTKEGEPTWDNLWRLMGKAIEADGIILPANVSQTRLEYLASCEKVNPSIRIIWRKKSQDGSTSQTPEDHGLPVTMVYGSRSEIKMRDIERLGCGVEGIIRTLYNGTMEVVRLTSQKWSYNVAMGRPGEEITLPEEIASVLIGPTDGAREFNEGIRERAEIVANVDNGFVHCLKYFRDDLPVTAAIGVENGRHGEYGWGVYFGQGWHRCILTGTVVGCDMDSMCGVGELRASTGTEEGAR
jgi:hypothetical protein